MTHLLHYFTIYLVLGLSLCATAISGYSVSGTVVDTKAKPLAGVKVYASPDSTQFAVTNNQGKFNLGPITLPIRPNGTQNTFALLSDSRFFLPGTVPTHLSVSLFDLKGRPVHSLSGLFAPGENRLNLSGSVPPGSYTFQASGEGLQYRTRVEFDGKNLRNMGRPSPAASLASAPLAKNSATTAQLIANRQYYHTGTASAADGATNVVITLEKLPNIVLLLSDDQSWTDYAFMGHPHIKTPRLDKLVKESMTFTRGYTPTSLCRPALMTLATGQYPKDNGVTGNDHPKPGGQLYGSERNSMLVHIDRAVTLQKLLHEKKGYTTLQTGKWWEGDWRRGHFTSGMTINPERGVGEIGRWGRHGDFGLDIGRTGIAPIKTFIDSSGERPFYVWYAAFLPHTPHNPPERLLSKYRALTPSLFVAKYWAMVEWFDETCGDVLDLLEAKGLTENTLVFYTADNGWVQNPNDMHFDPVSKRAPYDLGTRTPIMVKWPGKIKPEWNDSTLVSNIDFMPTALAAAGIEIPANLPGLNLLDSAKAARQRPRIFGDIYEHDILDIHDPVKTLMHRWVIDGRWKLIQSGPFIPEKTELFDIIADPYEKKNVAAQNPSVVNTLKGRINEWYPITP